MLLFTNKNELFRGILDSCDLMGNIVLKNVGEKRETIVMRNDTIMFMGVTKQDRKRLNDYNFYNPPNNKKGPTGNM